MTKLLEQYNRVLDDINAGRTVKKIRDLESRIAELESQLAEAKKDAERYRWLRDTLTSAVGGGVMVNDAALVYEESEPGEAVQVYWYPDTPVGFYESKADSLDEAIDAAIASVELK